jgi:exonuclease III
MDRVPKDIRMITSFNCNGIGRDVKRLRVFKWLKKNHKGIIMIQETHCTNKRQRSWNKMMGKQYEGYFANHSSRSCGVLTFVPERLLKHVVDSDADDQGRMLLLTLVINNCKYIIVNIYAPTQDYPVEQTEFVKSLDEKLKKHDDAVIIIGGDFNMTLNPIKDRYNCKDPTPTDPTKKLLSLMDKYNLSDIWRCRNPNLCRYTWRRTRPKLQQSRLDFFLISKQFEYNIDSCDIEPGMESDHNLVNIMCKDRKTQKRGKGYWKLNSSLLNDATYVFMIYNLLEKNCDPVDNEDPKLTWDTLKMKIRRETINYSIRKAKLQKKERKKLKEQLSKLETEISAPNVSRDTVDLYNVTKSEWEMNEKELTRGAILRSKAQWVEEGETNSRFFLNLEKYNQELKTIITMQDEDGTILEDPDKIMNHITNFYKGLYAPGNTNKSNIENIHYEDLLTDFVSNTKMSQEDMLSLESDITEKEIYQAISSMPGNKSPGSDGITVEFYKKFWNQIKNPLSRCFRHIFESGELSIDQKTGIINLIPKADKDLLKIKNWRPISLLNVDYKILTKILATRLKPILPNIIHTDQCGYVLDRLIGENIRIVDDLISYCEKEEIGGLLIFLDFEKAFDSLDWNFIKHTLLEFGTGPKFRKWIDILYNDINSSVSNNGYLSESFKLKRGIRQGCPISAYIFIMCAELLAQKIRQSSICQGINISDTEFKLLQFADDTVLIVNNVDSLRAGLNIVKDFSVISGLRINRSKTEIFNLGTEDVYINNLLKRIGLKISEEPIRYLGIWFTKDKILKEYKNYRHKIEKIENLLKIWKQRDLSLKGKITVLKSLAVSQLIFPLTMLVASEEVVKEVENLLYNFLWNGKPDRISRSTMIRDISEGGLKMIDVKSMISALNISWLDKFYIKDGKKWKVIPNLCCHPLSVEEFAMCSYKKDYIPKELPPFYKQCLLSLDKCKEFDKDNTDDILNQGIWFNKNITVGGKPLYYPTWWNGGIKILGDIVDHNGELLQPDVLEAKYNIDMSNFLEYFSLRAAIPGYWKMILKCQGSKLIDRYEMPIINVAGHKKLLKHVSTNNIYWRLVHQAATKKEDRPKAFTFWEELDFMNENTRKKILYIPFIVTSETKIQSLQFKIFHNTYITREKLFKWQKKNSPLCTHCGELDTLTHHFAYCEKIVCFWNSLSNWWHIMCPECDQLSDRDILLGSPYRKCHFLQFNYIILAAKWYIYRQNYNGEPYSFFHFLPELKKKILMANNFG